MKIRYIQSACVIVEHAGIRVLCDPWLTDGAYYGSWNHCPPLTVTPEDVADVEYLYISHVHPDHLDVATLQRLPRTIPVLIHDYQQKFIRNTLQRAGFTKVIEVANQQKIPLGRDFSVEILAADNCDPQLCGRFFGCLMPQPYPKTLQIDSMAVFHGAGKTVVNANDCIYALAHSVCDYVRDRYKAIDLLMVGYAGAGAYPQCFENLDDGMKLQKAARKRAQFFNQARQYVEHLRPAHVMPFAGRYTLGGRLAALNRFRGVPEHEEAGPELRQLLQEHRIDSSVVHLNSGETFDVESGVCSAPYTPPDPERRARYIDEVLSKKRLLYEDDPRADAARWEDLTPRLQTAQEHMLKYQDRYGGYRSPWGVYLDTGQEELYRVSFEGRPTARVARGSEQEPFVRIGLDYALLVMMLDRQAHWDNAEIGSHLRFFRKPDEYDRGLYHFLSYLHG